MVGFVAQQKKLTVKHADICCAPEILTLSNKMFLY